MKAVLKTIILIWFTTHSVLAVSPFEIKRENAYQPKPMPMDGWRFGFGLGYAFNLGSQMDHKLTRNYGDFNELRTNLTISGFKKLDEEKEWGLVYKVGAIQSLTNNDLEGFLCNFQEIQSVWQRSLNDNIGLNAKRITFNLQYGIGVMYYKSKYFAINHNTLTEDYIISSVGYNLSDTKDMFGNPLTNIPNKKFALVGDLGLNIGFRLTRNTCLYFENSIQISTTNKLTGKLVDKSKIPPDGYFYSGLSIFYRFGMAGGRMSCPNL